MDSRHENSEASDWVRRFAPLIAPGGRVLDLACGGGRHARWLAAAGHPVVAIDRDAAAIAALAGVPGIEARCADLESECEGEGGPWPCAGETFAGIVVANYLWRPLLSLLPVALDEGGVLIYETFMLGNERFGRPSNPAFLLRPGELRDLVRGRLDIVAFEEGEVSLPRPAMVQRICAVRRS